MKKNSLAEKNPELAKEWHPTLNGDLTPWDVTCGSGRKIWWVCKKGHEWDAAIYDRNKGNGCPFCARRKCLSGYNDLETINPALAKIWHPTLNGDLKPGNVAPCSNKKVWWKCSEGHEWEAIVNYKNRRDSCPYCSGRIITKGINDLATTNPELAKEWHPMLNGDLTPGDVTKGSNKVVWWQCPEHVEHRWEARVYNRSRGGCCPYCSNRKILAGYNDLATYNPVLAKEWHPTLNGDLNPADIAPFSNKKVWWRCEKEHNWQAVIASRSCGAGCKKCNAATQTSFPEQAIYYYLKKAVPVKIKNRASLFGVEVDVYIPSWNIGIEYDGMYFHNSATIARENKKNLLLFEKGIRLIRIKESSELTGIDQNVIYCTPDGRYNYLKSMLDELAIMISDLQGFPIDLDVNIQRDSIKIMEQYIELGKQQSLDSRNPILSAEWHPVKNGRIKPDQVSVSSGKKIWWQCKERPEHQWQATVNERNNGSGCPYCSNRKIMLGYNDLETTNPKLAKEWHPLLNRHITPKSVTYGSEKKIWWLCGEKHEWEATIVSRSRGNGCPYCSGRIAIEGVTDLETALPELAKEWHSILNGTLTPLKVTAGSKSKVWWQCSNHEGHRWEATILNRANGNGCPYCSNHRVLVGYNDLETIQPNLAKEWHPILNGDLTAKDVSCGSSQKVWWQCYNHPEHQWKTTISSRNIGRGCPYCSNRNVLKGYNDLGTLNPELGKEWNTVLNGNLTINDISCGSTQKVWWQCSKHSEHSWKSTIYNRNSGRGCPYCSNKKVLLGYNDLFTTNPDLSKEWHPTRNGDLVPFNITAGSSKNVWWQCDQKHEWQAVVAKRRNGYKRCPECTKLAKQNAKNN